MSLHNILMERAALEHPEFREGFGQGALSTLWSDVAEDIKSEQARVQKQRDAERESKTAIENYNKVSGGSGSGKLIPKLTIKDGKYEFSASTPSSAERKSQFELENQQNFITDVQYGVDASTLRMKYPQMSDDIDKLEVAGTVKSRIIPKGTPVVPEGMISKGTDALGRPLGYAPKGAADIKAEADIKASEAQKQLEGEKIVESAKDTLSTIQKIKSNLNEFGIRGVLPDMPGTKAFDWTANVNKLKSQKIIDLMADMKRVSKTGATGFGQLSEKELKILQDASTALSLGSPKGDAKVYLDNMEAAVRKIIAGSQKVSTPQSLQPTDFQNFDKMNMPEFDAAQRIKNLKAKYGLQTR